jgi:hypothetical protein
MPWKVKTEVDPMDAVKTRITDPAPLPAEHLDAANYAAALSKAQQILESDSLSLLDAVIHGVGVRLYTNNSHWHRFWSANWFAPSQWAALTGVVPPDEPKVHIYATSLGASESLPASAWAGYSFAHSTGFLAGDAPYGPLRALALGAVAHWLADEEAVHFVPSVCVRQDGAGSLMLDAPGVDRAAAAAALMESDGMHLLAFDGVFVRYGLVRMVDGVTMLPTHLIDEQGTTTRGYRLFPWLDDYGFIEPRADTRCLTLAGKREYCFARDLDLGRAPDAMAYPFEQAWYLPTQVVAGDPVLVGALWPPAGSENGALLENVPPHSADLEDQFGGWASRAASTLSDAPQASARSTLEQLGQAEVAKALCRLRAVPESRVLIAPNQLWPGRSGGNPWQPMRIRHVTLLGSDEPMPLEGAAVSAYLTETAADLSGLYEEEANKILTTELERATSSAS